MRLKVISQAGENRQLLSSLKEMLPNSGVGPSVWLSSFAPRTGLGMQVQRKRYSYLFHQWLLKFDVQYRRADCVAEEYSVSQAFSDKVRPASEICIS
jgi:hypothetical protein